MNIIKTRLDGKDENEYMLSEEIVLNVAKTYGVNIEAIDQLKLLDLLVYNNDRNINTIQKNKDKVYIFSTRVKETKTYKDNKYKIIEFT